GRESDGGWTGDARGCASSGRPAAHCVRDAIGHAARRGCGVVHRPFVRFHGHRARHRVGTPVPEDAPVTIASLRLISLAMVALLASPCAPVVRGPASSMHALRADTSTLTRVSSGRTLGAASAFPSRAAAAGAFRADPSSPARPAVSPSGAPVGECYAVHALHWH